eukprot:1154350-Pelagomonas_calceolata.AAC.6
MESISVAFDPRSAPGGSWHPCISDAILPCAFCPRWLGTFLPAVEIEEWGTFKFLVCRLRGRGGKQRICVRGRNYYTQSQIIDDISRKVRDSIIVARWKQGRGSRIQMAKVVLEQMECEPALGCVWEGKERVT